MTIMLAAIKLTGQGMFEQCNICTPAEAANIVSNILNLICMIFMTDAYLNVMLTMSFLDH
jgi:hypothetical protein